MKRTLLLISCLAFSVLCYSQAYQLDNSRLDKPKSVKTNGSLSGLNQVLYFTTRSPDGGGGVHFVILDDNAPVIQDFAAAEMSRPYGIAIDTLSRKVFVSDYQLGIIYRFEADGTNPVRILDVNIAGQEIVESPEALMVVGDKLFWGRTGGIYRCNLDGSSPEIYINTGTTAPEYPLDMQYDAVSGKIYLVNDKSFYSGGYFTMNFDGIDLAELIPDIDGTAIEVNAETNKVYIVGYAAPETVMPENGIYMCNTDGTQLTKIGDYGIKATWGITIDHERGKLFWGCKFSNANPDGKIIRANLDGSDQEDWITGISPHAMQVVWINQTNVTVPDNTVAQVQVFPNPTRTRLLVNGDFSNARIVLYSIDGRIAYIAENESRQADIDVSTFERGLYFLRVETLKAEIVQKIALVN